MPSISLFDAHCDTLSEICDRKGSLDSNTFHIALDRASSLSRWAQFFAVFGDAGAPGFDARDRFARLSAAFYEEIEKNSDKIAACRTASDIEAAHRAGKAAGILSVEGAELLEGLTADEAYERGVRMVTLTWNHENALGGSCADNPALGLTDAGLAFVRRAGELGIIIDVSHGSEALFWDVARVSSVPFIASHSNAYSICPHRRNLKDEQFKAIVAAGGVAGINLYAAFVREGGATIDDVVRHIEHFLSLGGEKNIAIGADFDGCDELPAGISGLQDMEKLAEALARRGHSAALIRDIFYENLFRVVRTVLG